MKTLLITLNYNASNLMNNLWVSLQDRLPKDNSWHWLVRENSDKDVWTCEDTKRVTVVKKDNKGNFASMHNELMREGLFDGYDNICLLNNDMIAQSDFLTPMNKIINHDTDVGAVGALLLYPTGHLQHAGVAFTKDLMAYNVNQGSMQKLNLWPTIYQHNREFQAVTGACLLMRTQDYYDLKGMDESYQWAYDDVDLCLRIGRDLKKKCIYCKDAKLIHYENYSTLKNPTELKPNLKHAYRYLNEKFSGYIKDDTYLYESDYGKYKS